MRVLIRSWTVALLALAIPFASLGMARSSKCMCLTESLESRMVLACALM